MKPKNPDLWKGAPLILGDFPETAMRMRTKGGGDIVYLR